MTERKTDLAVVVGRLLDRIAVGHPNGADNRQAMLRKPRCVMVPGREDCLEQKCDDPEQRGHPAASLRRPFDPQTSGKLPKHAHLKPPLSRTRAVRSQRPQCRFTL